PQLVEVSENNVFDRKTLLGEEIDSLIANRFGLTRSEQIDIERDHNEALNRPVIEEDEADEVDELQVPEKKGSVSDMVLSWAVGVAFGRFDWRLATGEREAPPEPEPFDPLPAKSPGMLPDDAEPFYAHSGILVDDQGHR